MACTILQKKKKKDAKFDTIEHDFVRLVFKTENQCGGTIENVDG